MYWKRAEHAYNLCIGTSFYQREKLCIRLYIQLPRNKFDVNSIKCYSSFPDFTRIYIFSEKQHGKLWVPHNISPLFFKLQASSVSERLLLGSRTCTVIGITQSNTRHHPPCLGYFCAYNYFFPNHFTNHSYDY